MEGFRSEDERFQRFSKNERKELKLFKINFSVEIVGGGVKISREKGFGLG